VAIQPPIFSSRLKKSWLAWLLIPAGLAAIIYALPVLLFGMLIGSQFLTGPVNIWNATWHSQSSSDIAGYYQLAKGSSKFDPGWAAACRRDRGFG
jgi:hypothetical protein